MQKVFNVRNLKVLVCSLMIALIIAGVFPMTAFAAAGDGTLSFTSIPNADSDNKFTFTAKVEIEGTATPTSINVAISTDSNSPAIESKQNSISAPTVGATSVTYDVSMTGKFDPELVAGVYNVTVRAYYIVSGNVRTATATLPVKKTLSAVTPTPTATLPTNNGTAIVLSSVDSKGSPLTAPSGNFGESIRMVVPVRNKGGYITEFDLRMDVGTDPTTFPFDMSGVSYVRHLPDMLGTSGVIDTVFNLQLSKYVTKGVKAVNFTASYKKNGVDEESKFTVYVNVVKGAPDPTPVPSGVLGSAAKLIVSGYVTDPERLFAGEPFELKLTFQNTSDKDDVRNIKITLKNEDGAIIPAASGSNTLYIKSIPSGKTETKVVKLQSRPDASPKPYTVAVALDYEGANSAALTATESITLPVAQKMRVVIEDPRVMADGATVEAPVSVSFGIFNMGKAPLYNLMVDLEGEGARMEERFFGGTVAAGTSSRADFNIIPKVAGQIDAKLIITYENEYGEQTREEKPISMNIMEMAPMPGEGGMIEGVPGDMPPQKANNSLIYIIGGGVVVGVGLIVLFVIRRRKKKAKEFEDVNL